MGARSPLLAPFVVAAVAAVAAVGVRSAAEPDGRQQTVSGLKTGGPTTLITLRFGPQQVWQPSQGAIADLHKCTAPISLDCVRKVMAQHGASADAFEFYHLTGWFLSELKATGGPVMLALVANPWRANENEQPALVGGNPVVVYPEEAPVTVENDAGFRALKADFPQLIFWKSGPTLEANAMTAASEKFIFRYRLLDGCRACAIRGWARIEFDFAPDGSFQRTTLLGVVRQ